MKLLEYRIIRGKIETKTGLSIGGSSDTIEIGGNDNPVIRDGKTNKPYIPGSSLKGKARSLLEWYLGKINKKGKPHNCKDESCFICRSFGISAGENEVQFGPGRLLFRDCYLTTDSEKDLQQLKEKTGHNFTEVKTETTINRLDSSATPRPMERVPAGVSFEFELVYKIIDMGDNGKVDKENYEIIKKGLKMLELDAIGGSGSRGYGKIEFKNLTEEIKGSKMEINLNDINL
ncbi:MAG: type III-A CRISPR-associated RAMP protein Csm3 [Candidatus Woesearchaeota archaeon]